jgi:hypothetical protein
VLDDLHAEVIEPHSQLLLADHTRYRLRMLLSRQPRTNEPTTVLLSMEEIAARLLFCEKATPMKECDQFADDLWIVEGPNVRDFEIVFTTRMIIARLSDGSLWVDSPVLASSDHKSRNSIVGRCGERWYSPATQ